MSSERLGRAGFLGCIAFIALVGGCAQAPPQKAPEPPKRPTVGGVITPEGWVREYNLGGQLMTSRDGYCLQAVIVTARSSADAFPAIKKGVSANTLPSEVADLHIANMKAAGAEQLEVLQNEPAQVAGLPGYRLVLRHYDTRGLELRRVVYGTVDETYFYRLIYEAPALYFFERDLPAFEAMASSFQRYSDFDAAVKGLEAGSAPPSAPRWAAVRPDPLPQKKNQ